MISGWFLRLATLFGVAGLVLGIQMGAAQDHSLMPVHAHLNLVGWVSMFLYGLFYRAFPHHEGRLAAIQLCLATLGMLVMAPGIYGAVKNLPWGEPMAIAGSFLTLGAFLIFTLQVFRATNR